MPKKRYEATFYYQVTLVREGVIEIEVPDGAAADFNPLVGLPYPQVAERYEGELGEPEMLVDDETPEGERLTDILLRDPENDSYVRASVEEGEANLVAAPVEMFE